MAATTFGILLFSPNFLIIGDSSLMFGIRVNSLRIPHKMSQKSWVYFITEETPIPNDKLIIRYACPLARRHKHAATFFSTGVAGRKRVSSVCIWGRTISTILMNVSRFTRKLSFHQSPDLVCLARCRTNAVVVVIAKTVYLKFPVAPNMTKYSHRMDKH